MIFSAIGYSFLSPSRTSAFTENPVLVFFELGSQSFTKSISQTCLGDLILNASPASA